MEAFMPGIMLTIIGMGVVFGSLIVLMVVILLLERFVGPRPQETDVGDEEAETSPQVDELDIILAAAAGHYLETESPDAYIPPVHRSGDSHWARTARAGHLSQRRRR